MRAITVKDRAAGAGGLSMTDMPYPDAAENDVVVRVYAAGFTHGELDWPTTWSDRAGRDRTPSVPGHELSGVVAELGYGTTGLTVGQRVFGLADWTRDGTLAEYVAVEARNLAPLPADVDHTTAAALAGLFIGFYDGVLGPGTGSFFVFALVGLLGYSFLEASAKAKMANWATNVAALAVFAAQGAVVWKVGLLVGACQVIGSYVGARTAVSRGSRFVRIFFVVVVSAFIVKIGSDVVAQWWGR